MSLNSDLSNPQAERDENGPVFVI